MKFKYKYDQINKQCYFFLFKIQGSSLIVDDTEKYVVIAQILLSTVVLFL